ncbi:MAG: OB-fold domain-containing protein [Acidimicrobiales bacterium]|nr:OB-fold domain-containing protein [Acidimicrobiales bacterium]
MPELPRPAPTVTADSAVFWDAAAEGRLVAQRCASCGELRHPPRPMCPWCHSLDVEVTELSGLGTVYSFERIHYPPTPYFDYPVPGILVELDEGIRLVSSIVGVDDVDLTLDGPVIGMRVQARFEPTADQPDGTQAMVPVFEPAPADAPPAPERAERPVLAPRGVSSSARAGTPQVADRAAIVGIGQTEFSKRAGRSELQLASESITAALDDAGLSTSDVDGIVTYTVDPVEETELIRSVGFDGIAYSTRIPYGGGGSMGVLVAAATAIASGAADVVVAYRAIRARSGSRFGGAKVAPSPTSGHSGTLAMQWCMPYGVMTPASWMGLNSVRYMHRYGVTSADIGRAVVQMRDYASTNPAAWGYDKPITLDDHQSSRWIVEPAIRLFDCCQETDGSVAVVLTSAERAADLAHRPVLVRAVGMSGLFDSEIASDHQLPDLSVMAGSVGLADRLFGRFGISRDDIDAAMIYDAFSPLLLMQLEALGFCGLGEAKDFIADGNLTPTGSLPTNTHGGLIGEGYIHGLNLVTEATRQLRGTAVNQLDDPRTILVTASRTGAILGVA